MFKGLWQCVGWLVMSELGKVMDRKGLLDETDRGAWVWVARCCKEKMSERDKAPRHDRGFMCS